MREHGVKVRLVLFIVWVSLLIGAPVYSFCQTGETANYNQYQWEKNQKDNCWVIKSKKDREEMPSDFIRVKVKLFTENIKTGTLEFSGFTFTGAVNFATLGRQDSDSQEFLVKNGVTFTDCTFEGKFTAREKDDFVVVFKEPLRFIDCGFRKDVIFDQAIFISNVTVKKVHFVENAIFFKCEFHGNYSLFEDVEFAKEAVFSLCKFHKKIDFNKIRCKDNALFKRIEASDEINFANAGFQAEVDFGSSNFSQNVGFVDANFAGPFLFIKVNENLMKSAKSPGAFNFNGANFKEKAFFRESYFSHASFSHGENQPMIFFDHADFRRTVFKSADFSETSFDTVDFSHAKFGENGDGQGLSLTHCSYKQMTVSWRQISKAVLEKEDYRNLRNNFEAMKNYDDACDVYYDLRLLEWSEPSSLWAMAWNSIAYVFGYFVMPITIIVESAVIIVFCALFYAGATLKPFTFDFSPVKEEKKLFISQIPIETEAQNNSAENEKQKPPEPPPKNSHITFLTYIKNLLPALCFSFTVFFKLHLNGCYISKKAGRWLHFIVRFQWYTGYVFFILLMYSLSRRSSILHDIFSGLPVF